MFRSDARGRLADKVASYLRGQLPEDLLVLARYAPRDGGAPVPIVIVGRGGLTVIEPRDEDCAFVCYQDHWYRAVGIVAHPLGDAPSVRARENGVRVKRALGNGGFINVKVEALVLLTRGEPLDVRSSCVPVIGGLDALVQLLLSRPAVSPDSAEARALAAALDHPIKLVLS